VNPALKVWNGIRSDFKAFRMVFGSSTPYGSYGWSYWLSGRSRFDYAGAVGIPGVVALDPATTTGGAAFAVRPNEVWTSVAINEGR
jgi:hypothetical protein